MKWAFVAICVLVFIPISAFADDIDKGKLYDFVTSYLILGAKDYNNLEKMNKAVSNFTPWEKTAIQRIIRKKNLEEFRLGIEPGRYPFSELEYQKGQLNNEIFTEGEDIALAIYRKYLGDLPEAEFNAIFREVNREKIDKLKEIENTKYNTDLTK